MTAINNADTDSTLDSGPLLTKGGAACLFVQLQQHVRPTPAFCLVISCNVTRMDAHVEH